MRLANGGVQIVMETRRLFAIKKSGERALQLLGARGFPAGGEVAVAAAEHAVHVAVQIAPARPHRRRVAQHHQQPHRQRQAAAQQIAD